MTTTIISRRQMLKLLALGSTGAVLAACGGGTPEQAAISATSAPAAQPAATIAPAAQPAATSAPAASTNAPTKLVIMSAGQTEQNAPLAKAIEEANPGVTVEWRYLPSERYVELFTAAEVAGDQIDLMDLNGQDMRRYALGNKLRDLSDISYKDRFQDVGLKTYTVNGKLWALPRGGISGFTFFYNKKLLQQAGMTKEPETYDDLLALAPALQKQGIATFTHPGKNIYLWPVWQFWAFAQTTNNQAVEMTFKTLSGDMKFTAPEHVAALETLAKFAQDKLFIDSVNSLDGDGAWLNLNQGKAAFWYQHSSVIGTYRKGTFPDLDLGVIAPVRAVASPGVKRQMPGGTGNALAVYAKVAPEREQLVMSVLDLMTSDKWVKWANDLNKDPVSCNKNVQASTDDLAVKYAKECAPNQITYLDWYWPPEIVRAFQENQQAIIAGTKKSAEAAQAIQSVFDGLVQDGYKFAT